MVKNPSKAEVGSVWPGTRSLCPTPAQLFAKNLGTGALKQAGVFSLLPLKEPQPWPEANSIRIKRNIQRAHVTVSLQDGP